MVAQTGLTTSGTDFWFGFMNNYLPGSDAEFTVFISSEQSASGIIEIPLLGWSQAFNTVVGQTTAIEIPAIANNNVSGMVENRGVHLTSSSPINVYAMNHVNNSADATRILPKPFLDISYFVHGYQGQTNLVDTLRSELLIVATENGTELNIIPACDLLGGFNAGVPFTVQLDQGETLLLKANETEDISGTLITGTEESGDCRPFAVFGGSECSFVPELCSPCDHIFDQITPSSIWGTEYFLVGFDTWISSYTYRITALENGTVVSVNGTPTFTLNAGQVQEVNSNADAVYLSANQPIGVIQYMEGGGCTISGDPSMMSVNAVQQTMTQVTFTTIESPIITEHHLQVIVPTGAIDAVVLDGITMNSLVFEVFNGNAAFSFADIEIPEGSHQLQCSQGFIANVYGIGDAESYLYSTGAQTTEPPFEIIDAFCTENQVVLQASTEYTSTWWSTLEDPENPIFTGPTFVIDPPIANQIYILNGNNFLSGCPVQEFYSVESPAPLSVNIIDEVINLCLFEEYNLESTVTPSGSSYVYQWTSTDAFSVGDEETGTINPAQSGTYYLDVSTFSGCAVGTDSVLVNVVNNDVALIEATASLASICEGQTVELEVLTGFNSGTEFFNGGALDANLWADSEGTQFGNVCGVADGSSVAFIGATRFLESADFDMSQGGGVTFSIQISDGANGCDGAETGENVILQFSVNGGASWTTLMTLFENQYPQFQSVEVVLPEAAETASTRFRWIQPVFSGANEDVWWLDNIVFSTFQPSASGFVWSSEAAILDPSSATTTSMPAEDVYFYVETDINGCIYSDSVFVEVHPAFEVSLNLPQTICEPSPVPLSAPVSEPGFYEYTWDNAQFLNVTNGPNVVATPTQTTEFTVIVTSPAGCSSSASTTISLISNSAIEITPTNPTICSVPHQLEVVVDGNPADYIFEWSPAGILDNTNTQIVNASPAAGTFTQVQVIATNTTTGCVYTDTHNLSALFAEFNLPSDTIVCDSEGFVIEYEVINSAFNAIQWNNPQVLNNAFTAFPTITVPNFNGELIVTMFVPGSGGCSVSDTITIITQDLEYNAPDILSICAGSTTQAAITGDFSEIVWTPSVNLDASNPQLPIFSNNENETFYYSLSGAGGCELSDSIQVIYNLPSAFEIIAEGPFCEGGDIVLDNPLQGFTYAWSTGAITEDITVSTAGTYSLQVSDSAGCSLINDIDIQTLIPVDFEILGETFACAGESISLTADVVSDNYLWSNGATDQTAIYFGEGTTTVWAEIIDANNCAARDSLDIVFSVPIEIDLLAAGAICEGEPTALTAFVSEGDILWESGETTEQITVSEAGVYSVTVSDAFGCESTDSIEIFEVNFPALDLDSEFCEGASVILAPTVDFGFDFQWSNGEETSTIEVSEPGNYNLILSQFDCEQTYSFAVAEQPAPQLNIVIEGDFCSTELPAGGYPLTAVSDGAVTWQDGIEVEVLNITQSGVYVVSATSPEGCITTDEVAIVESCPDPAIYAPNAFTPDNDGLNDVWNVEYDGELTSFSLIIFDRDGNVVFRSADAKEYWIGNVNGGEYYAKDGVYNYLIKYSAVRGENGIVTNELRGHIVLLR